MTSQLPRYLILAGLTAVAVLAADVACAQIREEEEVVASTQVLNEIMAIPAQAIPQRLLADAEGIAIIPNVIKGGFVIGARYGRGTLVVRDGNRGWHAPVFITLTGGSVGWQAGVQSTDVILVFKTKRSIQGIFANKFTLGVDAGVAAGPVGRQASAATDLQLKAEIYSYARSRGLFLGASLDGTMLQIDQMANAAYYRSLSPQQPVAIPPSAVQLVQTIAAYCSTTVTPVQPGAPVATASGSQPATTAFPPAPTLAQQYSTNESDLLREQLSKTSPELFEQLDPAWRTFLALPAAVFTHESQPSPAAIQASLRNYEAVLKDPKYHALASMPAFQSTYGLLQHYASTLGTTPAAPKLPPPPSVR